MSSFHGKFVWYELMTTDRAAAARFYGDVVGWGAMDAGMPGMDYTFFTAGETNIGGLMTLPEEACKAGARPGWIGYVAVDDVDDYAGLFEAAGGAVHKAPTDIPGVGRFAVVADPQGTGLALFTPNVGGDGPEPAPGTPGRIGWHELMAVDGPAAFTFYSGMFGWRKHDDVDVGPMGVYRLFARGDQVLGGMMTKPEFCPMPFWLYYFNVDGIDAAKARVEAGGGRILNGPMEVPGGSWIVQASDPQGAMFALVGPRT